jgi:hypothetical protein
MPFATDVFLGAWEQPLSGTAHSAATSRACGRSDCSSRRAATGSGAEKSRVKILSPSIIRWYWYRCVYTL